MALNRESIKLVIAVDFGTSRSGYAYAFYNDCHIVGQENWDDIPGSAPYPKTLTRLLYLANGGAEAWGWTALIRFAEKRKAGEANNYRLFSNFKMELYKGKNRTSQDGPYIDRNSRRFFVIDLIADYLRFLKDFAFKKIKDEVGDYFKENEILWCVTVPAIWSNANKQLMRRAAERAGLISTSESDEDRLIFAYEPEAAARYCFEKRKLDLTPGTRFMILDCGGGTVDINVCEVQSDNKTLKEIATGTGAPCGSTEIDNLFLSEFIAKKISPEALEKFHDNEPIDYLKMMIDWEAIKCNFKSSNTNASFVPLPRSLYKILEVHYPKILNKLIAEQKEDGYFIISHQVMMDLFKPVLDRVVDTVKEQFNKLDSHGCDFIYLVGGFSTSDLLEQRIKQEFGSKVKEITKPVFPSAAIVRGAVSYALNPDSFIRCSRLTYGFDCCFPFEERRDPESKRDTNERTKKSICKDRFAVLVKSGDTVKLNDCREEDVTPSRLVTERAEFDILSTRKQSVRYTDEPGVNKETTIIFERQGSYRYSDLGWRVKFYFGKTELKVEVKDLATGVTKSEKLQFSHTYAQEVFGD